MTDCTVELEYLKQQYSILAAKLTQLLDAYNELSERIPPPKMSTLNHLGEAVTNIGPRLGESVSGVQENIAAAGDTLRTTLDTASEKASGVLDDTRETASMLGDKFKSGVDTASSKIGDVYESAKTAIMGEQPQEEEQQEEERQEEERQEEEQQQEARENMLGGKQKRKKTHKSNSQKFKKVTLKTRKNYRKRQ